MQGQNNFDAIFNMISMRFRSLSMQFQCNFNSLSNNFRCRVRAISIQFRCNFGPVSAAKPKARDHVRTHSSFENACCGHISFGLPGPLRAAFELKIALPTAKNQEHATALTEIDMNLLKRPKTKSDL